MVKFFSYPQIIDIESSINTWLKKNDQFFIISYTYNSIIYEGELRHNVMIVYNYTD